MFWDKNCQSVAMWKCITSTLLKIAVILCIHEFEHCLCDKMGKNHEVHTVCSLMEVHFGLQEWLHKCSRCDPTAVNGLTGNKMAKICTEQSYPSQRSAFTPEPAIEWIERGERSEGIPQIAYIDKLINILHLEQLNIQKFLYFIWCVFVSFAVTSHPVD